MKRLCQICIGLLAVVIVAEITAIVSVAIFLSNLTFALNGEKDIILNFGDTYTDEGVVATTTNWDLSAYVSTEQTVDTSHIGTYYVIYRLNFLNRRYSLERKVEIIDDVPPIITLNGDTEVNIYTNDTYTDVGATATDNYDGDITNKIIVQNELDTTREGEYEILYSVSDSSGNSASTTRTVTVEEAPSTEIAIAPSEDTDSPNVPYTADDPIADYIAQHDYDVSVGYYNLVNGKCYFYQGDKLYYGASLIKTLDAIYLYDNNMVDDNLKYYIDRAISVSDNDAHSYLVNYIGRDTLRDYGINLGAANTLSGDGIYGDTTVVDQIAYYKKAYELAKQNEDFKAPFINNSHNYIKINNLTTMHKHGYYDQWFHDAGIVFDDEPYIVVILTNHGKGNQYEVVHGLSEQVYEYHKRQL